MIEGSAHLKTLLDKILLLSPLHLEMYVYEIVSFSESSLELIACLKLEGRKSPHSEKTKQTVSK